jgi:hypothetical protein
MWRPPYSQGEPCQEIGYIYYIPPSVRFLSRLQHSQITLLFGSIIFISWKLHLTSNSQIHAHRYPIASTALDIGGMPADTGVQLPVEAPSLQFEHNTPSAERCLAAQPRRWGGRAPDQRGQLVHALAEEDRTACRSRSTSRRCILCIRVSRVRNSNGKH